MTNHHPDEQQFVTPGIAAKRLGVTTKTLARRADDGQLSVVRLDGGHRRYLEEEIEAVEHRQEAS